jgi:hypothetical protein
MNLRFLLFLVCLSAAAAEVGYVDKMIACDEQEERFVSEAFDAFLTLVAKNDVKKDTLHFPVRLATFRPDYIIFDRGFYISPNELRGFELVVPRGCLAEKNGVFTLKETVVVDRDEWRSGIRILVLKRKNA